MAVTPIGVAYLTRILKKLAKELCDGRILFTLEGGYNLQGLAECVAAVILELAGDSIIPADRLQELEKVMAQLEVISRVRDYHRAYWKTI